MWISIKMGTMFIVVTNAEVQWDVLLQEQACQMDGRKV